MTMNGKKQEKKPTASQMERRLNNAIIHIDKTKGTQSIFFDDKGLRITITSDYAIIATTSHQHIFNAVTPSGISRSYLYAQRFLEIALDNDCTYTDDKGNVGRSYAKLFALLKEKEDKVEYNLCWYIDLWLFNIHADLFSIDETEASAFIVYEKYLHNMARSQEILKEKKEDLTNIQFVENVIATEKKYMEGLEERVIFKKKTDEEQKQEEIDAMQQRYAEQTMEEKANEQQHD